MEAGIVLLTIFFRVVASKHNLSFVIAFNNLKTSAVLSVTNFVTPLALYHQ